MISIPCDVACTAGKIVLIIYDCCITMRDVFPFVSPKTFPRLISFSSEFKRFQTIPLCSWILVIFSDGNSAASVLFTVCSAHEILNLLIASHTTRLQLSAPAQMRFTYILYCFQNRYRSLMWSVHVVCLYLRVLLHCEFE